MFSAFTDAAYDDLTDRAACGEFDPDGLPPARGQLHRVLAEVLREQNVAPLSPGATARPPRGDVTAGPDHGTRSGVLLPPLRAVNPPSTNEAPACDDADAS